MKNKHHIGLKKRLYWQARVVLVIISCLVLVSCSTAGPGQEASNRQVTYRVELKFRRFYSDLGGKEVLGPAISPGFDQGTQECQFTLAALLCFNPDEEGSDRYELFPLVAETRIKDNPEAVLPLEGQTLVDGLILFPGFIPAYEAVGGSKTSGRLISSPRYNFELQRVEQYFENIGFYQKYNEPGGEVHLLPYGAAFCGERCSYKIDYDDQLFPERSFLIPFAPALEGWGGMSAYGRPLTAPFTAGDGNLEQVYENAVLYSPDGRLENTALRPLGRILGMPTTPPGPKVYDGQRQVVFYNLSDDSGYHVPILFDNFILAHGGMILSGNPIAEIMYQDKEHIPRQCFENYCLELFSEDGREMTTRLTPLGWKYLEQGQPAGTAEKHLPPTDLSVEIKEKMELVASGELQSIEATATNNTTGQPQGNIPAWIEFTLPDGNKYEYNLPITSIDGKTGMDLFPLKDLPDGSLVNYRVCLELYPAPDRCQFDSYLVWGP